MSNIGSLDNSNHFNIKEIAKNSSTAPTQIEKNISEKFVDEVKNSFNEIKDSVSDTLKTSEGKAIATGLVISTINPIIGLGVIFGASGLSAIKFLKENN